MSRDARRRRWIPFDAYFPHGQTAQNILNKFGPHGLLTWVCLLTAAKRNEVQGEFWYVTEEDAWGKLGIEPDGYTIDAFFTYTGHLKQTRRTRSGQLSKTTFTRWEDWNNKPRTGGGRVEKPTSYKGIPDYETRRNRAITAPEPRSDSDSDSDNESDSERDALTTNKKEEPTITPPPPLRKLLTELTTNTTLTNALEETPETIEANRQRQLAELAKLTETEKPF